jgi:hypothetical protein
MEEIRASDLTKLMAVVQAAAGLYNALEQIDASLPEFDELGDALRNLGVSEVVE